MFCENCGSAIEAGHGFCAHCGKAVLASAAPQPAIMRKPKPHGLFYLLPLLLAIAGIVLVVFGSLDESNLPRRVGYINDNLSLEAGSSYYICPGTLSSRDSAQLTGKTLIFTFINKQSGVGYQSQAYSADHGQPERIRVVGGFAYPVAKVTIDSSGTYQTTVSGTMSLDALSDSYVLYPVYPAPPLLIAGILTLVLCLLLFLVFTIIRRPGTIRSQTSQLSAPLVITAPANNTFGSLPAKRKSFTVAAVLTFFPLTGLFGIDRMYLGKWGTGVIKFLTGGGCLVWWVFDAARLAIKGTTDKRGNPLR